MPSEWPAVDHEIRDSLTKAIEDWAAAHEDEFSISWLTLRYVKDYPTVGLDMYLVKKEPPDE